MNAIGIRSVYELLIELVDAKEDLDSCLSGIYLGDNDGARKDRDIERASSRMTNAWITAQDYVENNIAP